MTWDQWQGSTTSKRLLPERARQEGYTVLRVPKDLRVPFLDVVMIVSLYEQRFQRPKQRLSEEQLQAFVRWSEATKGMIAMLQKEAHA